MTMNQPPCAHRPVLRRVSQIRPKPIGFAVLALCLAVLALGAACPAAHAQYDEWTYFGGVTKFLCGTGGELCWPPGVYGNLGQAAKGNIPGGRENPVSWTDSKGKFWLFGGSGVDDASNIGDLNDLWKFDPSTSEWEWVSGYSNIGMNSNGPSGIYGTLGKPDAANIPGGRDRAVSWSDKSGNLWLFGGYAIDSANNQGLLNDLWEYNPTSNEWTWIGGPDTLAKCTYLGKPFLCGQAAHYGTLGQANKANIPGSRVGAVAWTDLGDNLWLFGGLGFDSGGRIGALNDLWKFSPATGEWTWMSGSDSVPANCTTGPSTCGPAGVYGAFDKPGPANVPGGRAYSTAWYDSSGDAWLFGGEGYDSADFQGYLNDLWEYNSGTNQWVWVSGSSTINQSQCFTPTDVTYQVCGPGAEYMFAGSEGGNPGGRSGAMPWTDRVGHLWLLGGQGLGEGGDNLFGDLNDLWEYDPFDRQWTWWTGAANLGVQLPAVYDTPDSPNPASTPGGIYGGASWVDAAHRFWEFGGYGMDGYAFEGYLNDLWRFEPYPSEQQVAAPTFSPAPGKYTSGQKVTILDTAGAFTYYYTLDGSAPTNQSNIYTGAIPLSKTTTIRAVAISPPSYSTSNVATATYEFVKAQTISFTAPTTPVTYGVKPITLAATASSGLAVTFSVVSGPAKVSGSTLTITGAGTVVVAANQPGNSTYAAAPEVTRTIVVNPAKLTVTATSLTMKKGAAVPALTYTITGFVNGDTQATATTGKPALTTTATSKSATGKYPITVTAGTLAAKNYTLSFVEGTLTVD
jgi:N-acetylneuraminic acid mutarotase